MREKDIFFGIIDKLLEGVILLDKNKRVIFWNKWMEQASHIHSLDAVGRTFLELFPDILYTRIDSGIEQVAKHGQSSFISHIINPIMLPLYHYKEGTEKIKIFHNIRITALQSPQEDMIIMIYITDETASFLKEQQLRKKAAEEKDLNIRLRNEMVERLLIEERLELSNAIIVNTREGVVITDENLVVENTNPAYLEIMGYAPEETNGKHISFMKSGKHDQEFYKKLWDQLSKYGYWKGEFVDKKSDGSLIVLESSITAIRNHEGKVKHYVNIFHDVTERKKYEEMLEIKSRTDPLTGLSNRRAFDEALDVQWRICMRHGFLFGVIMIDVDFFKNYNDTYGHQAGDDCLVKIAGVLRANVRRADDIIARYGGEEFVIVVTQTDQAGIKLLVETILKDVESLHIPYSKSETLNYVTISAGIGTVTPWNGLSANRIIEIADTALYQAKKSGRNKIVIQNMEKTNLLNKAGNTTD